MSIKQIQCNCKSVNEDYDCNEIQYQVFCTQCDSYAIIKEPNDNPIGLKDLGEAKGIQNDQEC